MLEVDTNEVVLVEFDPAEGVGVGVIVKTMPEVNVVCTRPGPSPTTVVNDVERITDAVLLPLAVELPAAVELPDGWVPLPPGGGVGAAEVGEGDVSPPPAPCCRDEWN